MTEETINTEIAVETATPVASEHVQDTPVEATETTVETTAPETPDTTDHGNKGKTPWFVDRIAKLEQELEAAKSRRTETTEKPPSTQTVDDPRVLEAARRLRFNDDVNVLRSNFIAHAGQQGFNDALSVLNATGAASDEFVGNVIAVDRTNAHLILEKLSRDPEKAARIAAMSGAQQIAELTRMSMAPTEKPVEKNALNTTPPTKSVSKAPPPPPPVSPGGKKAVDWRSDESSEDEFQRGWEEMMERKLAKNGYIVRR